MVAAGGQAVLHWSYQRDREGGGAHLDAGCATLGKTRAKVRNESAVYRFLPLGDGNV